MFFLFFFWDKAAPTLWESSNLICGHGWIRFQLSEAVWTCDLELWRFLGGLVFFFWGLQVCSHLGLTVEPVSLERRSPLWQPNQQVAVIQSHLTHSPSWLSHFSCSYCLVHFHVWLCVCVWTHQSMNVDESFANVCVHVHDDGHVVCMVLCKTRCPCLQVCLYSVGRQMWRKAQVVSLT